MPTDIAAPEAAAGRHLEVSLVNDVRELARVGAAVDDFCSVGSLGQRLGYAVNLAVEEVLAHIIANAYTDDDLHRIEVAAYLDADQFELLVVHDGHVLQMRPPSDSAPTMPTEGLNALDQVAESDLDELGLLLVHQVMDSVASIRRDGCNAVVMVKQI